jgi:membrane associated rhomboid family serine protease
MFDNEIQITPVVRNLIMINIIMFVASLLYPIMNWLALYPIMTDKFRPFQFVTHFFMHAGFLHIFFNMYVLASVGSLVEIIWKQERFLFFYLFCALSSAFLHIGISYYLFEQTHDIHLLAPAVGASGAIFGVMVAAAFHFPDREIRMMFFPIPIKGKYMIPLMLAIEVISAKMNIIGDNVGHFAHLGGAIGGMILIFFWSKKSLF